LRRLLQQPVEVAVERRERVPRSVAASLLEDVLRLARDHERLLRLLGHFQSPAWGIARLPDFRRASRWGSEIPHTIWLSRIFAPGHRALDARADIFSIPC